MSVVCVQNHSSLASLNGLEAHLRAVAPGAQGASGQYMFAHYDCLQSTLKSKALLCSRVFSCLFFYDLK